MTKYDLKEFTTSALFKYFADILDEIKQRNVVRTRNNPVADYAEWLIAQSFDLSLERNSRTGYDGRGNWGQASQLHIFFFYFYFTFCEFVKPDPGSFLNK